jgi:hypothetical protein
VIGDVLDLMQRDQARQLRDQEWANILAETEVRRQQISTQAHYDLWTQNLRAGEVILAQASHPKPTTERLIL